MSVVTSDDERIDGVRVMLSAEQVLDRIPISRTTLQKLEREGLFPQGTDIMPHRRLWFLAEVLQWQRDLRDPNSAVAQILREKQAAKMAKGE